MRLFSRWLGRLRGSLIYTFSGDHNQEVPAWQLELADGDDPGYFGPDSAVWAVHGGMSTIPAGIRALLIQALHPGALAGVAEHSDYRADPFARLAGTIRWIFTVTYGSRGQARQACEYVRRVHVPVQGTYTAADGTTRRYAANDPVLAEWVHLAFTDAFLTAYENFVGPVPAPPGTPRGCSGADAYVAEWAVAGELMGVVDPPRSRAALKRRMAEFDDDPDRQLTGGPRVEEVISFLREPPLEPNLKPGYRALFVAVVDSLPPRYRELTGLRGSGVPRVTRLGGKATLALIGRVLGRRGPAELAARRRLTRLGVLPAEQPDER
ncbi:oxygenase MpaB family protein [Corynebacterium halotolerans]|uniref:ER-bound oxygenase mpaB/mpaB'/Rubber oxygenase catalytic domain-containing protein n=1 Tax=Corynebacterium halotolerans YIM 70093 = DSM 44683 TaxID=1121362 RepID=M1MUA7_9CORY|nr:oxygenase MpaB family protein [Corynebacterium halotolerans]AGF71319.1 hypothetical protein A605_01525 [Corynebacterium halotolerans YIM 70093 = DSM 44683]